MNKKNTKGMRCSNMRNGALVMSLIPGIIVFIITITDIILSLTMAGLLGSVINSVDWGEAVDDVEGWGRIVKMIGIGFGSFFWLLIIGIAIILVLMSVYLIGFWIAGYRNRFSRIKCKVYLTIDQFPLFVISLYALIEKAYGFGIKVLIFFVIEMLLLYIDKEPVLYPLKVQNTDETGQEGIKCLVEDESAQNGE